MKFDRMILDRMISEGARENNREGTKNAKAEKNLKPEIGNLSEF